MLKRKLQVLPLIPTQQDTQDGKLAICHSFIQDLLPFMIWVKIGNFKKEFTMIKMVQVAGIYMAVIGVHNPYEFQAHKVLRKSAKDYILQSFS